MDDLRTLGIRYLLEQVKDTIAKGSANHRSWVLVRREENMHCMAELGLTFRCLEEVLLQLSVADYCEGPLPDRDVPGELWVFGKEVEGKEVYIKIKLAGSGTSRVVRIISFHLARKSLVYPYRS